MPIKDKKAQPRKTANWIFLAISAVLIISTFLPTSFSQTAERVPYSTFIDQVKAHQVSSVNIGEKQILYQLNDRLNDRLNDGPISDGSLSNRSAESQGKVYETTPVFDLNLPTLLQDNDVQFSATPPAGNAWFGSLLSWVIPPLIFITLWRFFLARNQGGGQGSVFQLEEPRQNLCRRRRY